MRVFITGVCGFIGSHVAEKFESYGNQVCGIDNLETGRAENWPDYEAYDITNRRLLYGLANEFEPDLIVHCAASYKDPNLWHKDTEVNVAGAINVAAMAKHHDCRIIYFQTVLPPISSYAISKIAAQHYLELSGQPLTTFRLAAVYGPRNLSGPIPTFYKRIKEDQPCSVVRDTTRDFVFVKDLVQRVVFGETWEGTIDVRTGIETPISDLPHYVGLAMGKLPVVEERDRSPDDVAKYDMDGPPMASTPVAEGIAQAVAWYEEHGLEETYTHLKMKED